jgi:hypothetical protein
MTHCLAPKETVMAVRRAPGGQAKDCNQENKAAHSQRNSPLSGLTPKLTCCRNRSDAGAEASGSQVQRLVRRASFGETHQKPAHPSLGPTP